LRTTPGTSGFGSRLATSFSTSRRLRCRRIQQRIAIRLRQNWREQLDRCQVQVAAFERVQDHWEVARCARRFDA